MGTLLLSSRSMGVFLSAENILLYTCTVPISIDHCPPAEARCRSLFSQFTKYCFTTSFSDSSLNPTISSMLRTTSSTDVPYLTRTLSARLPTSALITKSSLKLLVLLSRRSSSRSDSVKGATLLAVSWNFQLLRASRFLR